MEGAGVAALQGTQEQVWLEMAHALPDALQRFMGDQEPEERLCLEEL